VLVVVAEIVGHSMETAGRSTTRTTSNYHENHLEAIGRLTTDQ